MGVKDLPFSIIKKHVDRVFMVREEQIAQATKIGFEMLKMTIEPSAAVAIAFLLFNEDFKKVLGSGIRNAGIILERGNIDTESHVKMMLWLDLKQE